MSGGSPPERKTAGRRSRAVLVVPCYNEAERLDVEAFSSFAAGRCDVRFLLVDDGSTDRTAAVMGDLRDADPDKFETHALSGNCGKAEAVRAGMLRATADEEAEFAGFWDADLSTPLDELPAFLDVLDRRPEIQMVFGARVNLLGRRVRRRLTRHYIGRVFATAVATALGLPIYDTQCGAKVFRVNDETRSLFREPFLTRWIFDVEIIARFVAARLESDRPPAREAIYELPLMRWTDVEGSKLRARDFVRGTFDLVRIRNRYLRRRRR